MRSLQFAAILASFVVTAGICIAAVSYDIEARKELRRADLSGAAGMEVISSVAEYKKGDMLPRHIHHGVEIGYILQGIMVQMPGKKPQMFETGAPLFVPRDEAHAGFTIVGDQPLKLFVVHVVDKNKPLFDWVK